MCTPNPSIQRMVKAGEASRALSEFLGLNKHVGPGFSCVGSATATAASASPGALRPTGAPGFTFLSVTAIMSLQQSHGANKKQLLWKPGRSGSRQMDLSRFWFLTFCSKRSTILLLTAQMWNYTGQAPSLHTATELCPTCAFTQ